MTPRNFVRRLLTERKRRVAVVTGAAQGIGRGIAFRLAKDGFDVLVNDLPSKSDLLEELVHTTANSPGGRCLSALGDVSTEGGVVDLVRTCVSRLGSLDVVCLSRFTHFRILMDFIPLLDGC